MPTGGNYIGIDRILALLVILESIHESGYEVITKSKLAKFVKNTSLVYWYPEGRELPASDLYREINPWFDAIFNSDLPQLIERGFAELSDKPKGVKLTKKGRFFGKELSGFPHYSKFDNEVSKLIRESKQGLFTYSPKLWRKIQFRSKELYKDEALVYDRLSADEKFLIGITVEPDKISSYIDPKPFLSAIKEKLKRKDILRAPHDKTQLQFLYETCQTYENAPYKEKPLVEVCGQCRKEETYRAEKLNLLVEGKGILIVAPNLPFSLEKLEYHAVRVIGIPNLTRGILRIEAIQIFDKGKYFPTNGRVL